MSIRKFLNRIQKDERGFTLIEMVMVLVIFAIMATITLFNFREFNDKASFNNLADDVALRVVSAQKAAISGTLNANFLGMDVEPSYGMYFSTTPTSGSTSAVDASSTQFVYFTDIPIAAAPYNGLIGDKIYNMPPGGTCPTTPTLNNECLSVTQITTGAYVSSICYASPGGYTGACSVSGTPVTLNVDFTRPLPDASLILKVGSSTTPIVAQSACVELSSPDPDISPKTIVITSLGEIRILNAEASSSSDCVGLD